jgi:L-fuconolactonase
VRIDAHHHLWDTSLRDYPWMDGPWADPLRGRFGPAELSSAAKGFDATIVVQALSCEEETRALLATAAATPQVVGVVGWTDLTAPDVADRLAALRAAPGGDHLVGIRHQVQDEPDPAWLLRHDVRRGLRAVATAGLVYDLLVKPRDLPAAIEITTLLPGLGFVLDHLGKPAVGEGSDIWRDALVALADRPNVTAKLSGLVTEADWRCWKAADLAPYLDHALTTFGPSRLMFGSDWPVCTLAAPYSKVVDLVDSAVTPADRAQVFGGTATRRYGLEELLPG